MILSQVSLGESGRIPLTPHPILLPRVSLSGPPTPTRMVLEGHRAHPRISPVLAPGGARSSFFSPQPEVGSYPAVTGSRCRVPGGQRWWPPPARPLKRPLSPGAPVGFRISRGRGRASGPKRSISVRCQPFPGAGQGCRPTLRLSGSPGGGSSLAAGARPRGQPSPGRGPEAPHQPLRR